MSKKSAFLLASMAFALTNLPVHAQGATEHGGIGAFSAGLGGGFAAFAGSKNSNSNKNSKTAHVLTPAPSEAEVERLLQAGSRSEKEKNWTEAERSYRSALTALSKAGKTDTPQRLALLERLSSVCVAQRKTGEAIGYFKTAVNLHQSKLGECSPVVIDGKQRLADLFVAEGDYNNAASYLGQAVTSADKAEPALPAKHKLVLLDSYSSVLRELGKADEAAAVDAKAETLRQGPPTTDKAPSK